METLAEKKEWQHGYELQYLKDVASKYDKYNSFTDSPFAEIKKNNIAENLYKKSLKHFGDAYVNIKTAKVRTKISMHGDTVIGYKEPGDIIIENISKHTDEMYNFIQGLQNNDCWLYVWSEWDEAIEFARKCNFKYVGSKITTFGEIHSVFFRDSSITIWKRLHPAVEGAETVNVRKCRFDKVDVSLIQKELENLDVEFTNHYSNYNKKGSWGAISLRGFKYDHSFIAKPIEMNKKWKAENEDWDLWECEDTDIRKYFPYVNKMLDKIPTDRIERIRFMSLIAGGGKLGRHTDQVDPHVGVADGKIMRLHIPIITNENMEFTSWSMHGNKYIVKMQEGEVWYLDIRKPHMAVNNGTETRIHLVVDIEANEKCRQLLT